MNALKQRTNEWMPRNNELINFRNLCDWMPWTKKPMIVRQETTN